MEVRSPSLKHKDSSLLTEINMFTDGGARGNPGPAAIGVVIKDNKHKVVHKIGKYIGVATNNDAEYTALIEGLVFLAGLNYSQIICHLDSELVVMQLKGLYKVKNVKIKKYWNKVKVLEKNFSHIEYKHVKRERNREADELVNQVLDSASIQ